MTMTRFERWSVWLTTAGTLVTGVAYWWMKELLTPAEPWAVINHPLQPWMLKAHILLAPLLVFSVGLITTRHVWRHFRNGVRKGRGTGLTAAIGFIALVITGYVLQVVTGETILRLLAWSHLGLGILYSVGVAAHWPATRPTPAEAARPPRSHPEPPRDSAGSRLPAHERRRRRTGRARSAGAGPR